jgi:hypothetical protein
MVFRPAVSIPNSQATSLLHDRLVSQLLLGQVRLGSQDLPFSLEAAPEKTMLCAIQVLVSVPRHGSSGDTLGNVGTAGNRRGVQQTPPGQRLLGVHMERACQEETLGGDERWLCGQDPQALLGRVQVGLCQGVSIWRWASGRVLV